MFKFHHVYNDIGLTPDDAVIARALMIAAMYTQIDERVLHHDYQIEAMAEIVAFNDMIDRKFGGLRDTLKREWHSREFVLSGAADKVDD